MPSPLIVCTQQHVPAGAGDHGVPVLGVQERGADLQEGRFGEQLLLLGSMGGDTARLLACLDWRKHPCPLQLAPSCRPVLARSSPSSC